MAFTEDFNAFFDTNDFAISATWTPDGGSPTSVTGIFDDEYFDEVGGSVGIEGSQPRFHCAAASVPNVAQGDTIVISGITYNIVNVQPDGTGYIVLILEEV